ncbi:MULTISPECIES: ThiF family adenylyltransferase [unclassified Bradyrhizobium]|uniref:HesA/MoeB/ThiF family protein n=1 Tax=unclassified Bradyrhizobium TaxID=2631580 RepID=UPI002915EA5F|nr:MULTISPECIES: ThiF family adenylyltransferase [unclassified Bradyrhizobium]
MDGKSRLFERIERLYDVGLIGQAKVLVAGCGSGGSQVALQLAMSGIRNFSLYDNQTLGEENVIRHACGLRYVGWDKTKAVSDLLHDRNPEINVDPHNEDLMEVPDLEGRVRGADVVILATDNEPSRYRLNEACVRTGTPFVVGRVFTRGIGGEVFAYRPKEGGCLGCLEMFLERNPLRDGIREIDLVSQEERDAMYGLPVVEIKDSPGLNVDIAFITNFHTRLALDAIARRLPERPKNMEPIKPNYVAWGNRPVHPFDRHFQIQTMTLPAINGCKICEEQLV